MSNTGQENRLTDQFLRVSEEKLTPLFKQYLGIKKQNPDCVLMYRLGDFYEMFGPDAEEVADVLGVVLTSREVSEGIRVPMCGIPHHSLMRYVKKLVDAGYKVALCDQLEEPDPRKKLVERGVTRIITAGTLVEDDFLAEDTEVFLVTVAEYKGEIGFCRLEATGGRVSYTSITGKEDKKKEAINVVIEEIKRVRPQELLLDEALLKHPAISTFLRDHPLLPKHTFKKEISEADATFFLKRFLGTDFLESYGLGDTPAIRLAIFYLVRYLKDAFRVEAPKLFFQKIHPQSGLILDERAQKHLELFSLSEGSEGAPTEVSRGLYGVLDRTQTPMGKRLLKRRLREPFREAEIINVYLAAVEEVLLKEDFRANISALLKKLPDSERILNRILLGRSNPFEVAKLRITLSILPKLREEVSKCKSSLFFKLTEGLTHSVELEKLLCEALADEPPINIAEGGVIRDGFSGELDREREIIKSGEKWFKDYEEKQRKRTGIRTLKVKRTDAFGWFIEVTKANLHLVPSDYQRRQTLVGSERFVTEELKRREIELVTSREKALELEKGIFNQILEKVKESAEEIHHANEFIGEVDYLLALAETARAEKWVKPVVDNSGIIDIKGGVHPLVVKTVGRQRYVPNDAYLDGRNVQINLITGPNMGGKSTYMRMIALNVILAHMGSFVACDSAHIGVCDRIFTRMGATEALVSGKSTFMVEMVETAEILHSATDSSLVILDEIGRGTSTYDGISIARAVVEYLHEGAHAHPKTLFATHYFELTEVSEVLPRVRNLKVEVRNFGDELVFLYKVLPGFVDESYGVEVARLAGLPKEVIERARSILSQLEDIRTQSLAKTRKIMQLGLFREPKG